MQEIFGSIEKIVFENTETNYSVALLKTAEKNKTLLISGILHNISPGENVRVKGRWVSNTKDNSKTRFEIHEIHSELPITQEGIFKYLTSKVIKGIGPKIAEKIIQKLGNKTLEIIENDPNVLLSIPGIGDKKSFSIIKQLKEKKFLRDLTLFLQTYNLPLHFSHKIYKKYGDQSLEQLKTNPFSLASGIKGLSFISADKIATKLGLPLNSVDRINSGIKFCLLEMGEQGHTCSSKESLVSLSFDLLNHEAKKRNQIEVTNEEIETQINFLISKGHLISKQVNNIPTIWLIFFYLHEKGIAEHLSRIKTASKNQRKINEDKAIAWVQEQLKLEFAPEQKEAIIKSVLEKAHVITGGPGTGKSTIMKAIITIFLKLTKKIILAAPTGKAAKRITEITNLQASTLHGLLQYDFQNKSFRKNENNPLNCDLIIIDETSMIDTFLMYHLLRAIPSHAQVVFIGDVYQLPSIGAGNVLKDIINSQVIACTYLKEIFRQAKNSQIIVNAHRINLGQFPVFIRKKNNDFIFFKKTEPEEALKTILELVSEKLYKWFRFKLEDIQVLSPMRKGILGITNLNKSLQKILNPSKQGVLRNNECYYEKDKVMQIRNNYSKEVFNGDVGYIRSIDFSEKKIGISFEGHFKFYSFQELDEINLAYATSIHKYQGSESPCIIIPLHTSHYMMLHRNLLYTAITRGKRMVILVGMGKAIGIAISKNDVQKRFTGLKEIILDNFNLS